ncbi:hypothetical protein INS49_001626 [Diaporthe citri]|uniref:uncharacterized protein n=1 Tax=Diaporthe citri TaxID=83186 RepID=UPI001C7E3F39|nr:uncharacterized protein INS49_001626 [Diaporthe citri]KAG6367437.1 hypothetical protein INS49_001626 [Diaporthe citri]
MEIRKSSIEILDEPHRDAVARAICKILSTEIAETTFAQIVDGLPLPEVLDGVYGNLLSPEHPAYHHTHLKSGTLDTVRRFREEFDLQDLQFDNSVSDLPIIHPNPKTPHHCIITNTQHKLLLAFQASSPGSRAFRTPLIEIAAVAVHQVAVLLYQNNPDLSSPTSTTRAVHAWAPPRDDESRRSATWWRFRPEGPPATLFCHDWYCDHAQYPNGVADVAGYWAENRVLGGVVLFDHAEAPALDAVYLHPDHDEVTYRICLLTDAQKKALLDFLLLDTPTSASPLPIIPDGTNTHRVDPEEPIRYTGIYRDLWERRMPPPE